MSEPGTNVDQLRTKIRYIFESYLEHDIASELKIVSEYFSYLGEAIDYRRIRIEADSELLNRFESITLWLHEVLKQYPEAIRNQIQNVLLQSKISEIVAVAANIPKSAMNRAWLGQSPAFGLFIALNRLFLGTLELSPERMSLLQSSSLFEAKVALKRLSQTLDYAASLKRVEYEASFEDFKANYDPDLINKTRVLALMHVLRVQASEIIDEKNRTSILSRLDELEAEVKKSKTKWGPIILHFFVLFGFLADLKTLQPDLYKDAHKTVETIIVELHQGGRVQSNKVLLEGPNEGASKSSEKFPEEPSRAILPSLPEMAPKSEDED